MSEESTELLHQIYAAQMKQNMQLRDLIASLASGLGREVESVGEDRRALRVKYKKSQPA